MAVESYGNDEPDPVTTRALLMASLQRAFEACPCVPIDTPSGLVGVVGGTVPVDATSDGEAWDVELSNSIANGTVHFGVRIVTSGLYKMPIFVHGYSHDAQWANVGQENWLRDVLEKTTFTEAASHEAAQQTLAESQWHRSGPLTLGMWEEVTASTDDKLRRLLAMARYDHEQRAAKTAAPEDGIVMRGLRWMISCLRRSL